MSLRVENPATEIVAALRVTRHRRIPVIGWSLIIANGGGHQFRVPISSSGVHQDGLYKDPGPPQSATTGSPGVLDGPQLERGARSSDRQFP